MLVNKIYFYKIKKNYQLTSNDCGLTCLHILHQYFYKNTPNYLVWLQNYYSTSNLSLKYLKEIGSRNGLVCNFYHVSVDELETIKIISPIILIIKNTFEHAIILYGRKNDQFYCFCPQKGNISYSFLELNYLFSGYIGIVNKNNNICEKLLFNSRKRNYFPTILYGVVMFLIQFNWVLLFLMIKIIYSYPDKVREQIGFLIIFIIYWTLFNIFLFYCIKKINIKYHIHNEIEQIYGQLINIFGSFLTLALLCLFINIDKYSIIFLLVSLIINVIINIFKTLLVIEKVVNIFFSFLVSSIIFYLFFNPAINVFNISWWWVVNMLIFNFTKVINLKKIFLHYNKIFFWVLNYKR